MLPWDKPVTKTARKNLFYSFPELNASKFALRLGNALLLPVTDRSMDLNVKKWHELLNTKEKFLGAIKFLQDHEHEFDHIVIDDINTICEILRREVLKQANKPDIESIPHGKGFSKIAGMLDREIIRPIENLRLSKEVMVSFIGIAKNKKFTHKDVDYSQNSLEIYTSSLSVLKKYVNEFIFIDKHQRESYY